MKFRALCRLSLFCVVSFAAACTHRIDARRLDIIESPEEVIERETDYMTYLRLKKAPGPLDQDYIILSGRLAREMARDDMFSAPPERVKVALRDVLNYHPTADVHPAVIHEYVEHALMNTRALWMVDGSTPYDYVLDVELSEVPVRDDDNVESKALAVMFVLFQPNGDIKKEWFGVLKREKGSRSWY